MKSNKLNNLKVEEVREELNKKGGVKFNSDDEKQFQTLENIARLFLSAEILSKTVYLTNIPVNNGLIQDIDIFILKIIY